MVGGQQSARSHGALRRHLPPCRRRRPARAARAWVVAANASPARVARDRVSHGLDSPCATSPPTTAWLSINTATVRGAGTLDRIHRRLCAPRHPRDLPPRDQVAWVIGLTRAAPPGLPATMGLVLSGYCRGGMFTTALDAAGRRAGARRQLWLSTKPCSSDSAAYRCSSSAACPERLEGRHAAVEGSVRGAARTFATASPGDARVREERREHAARDRAAPSACTPPTAPASTRWSRRSTFAMRWIPSARVIWVWPGCLSCLVDSKLEAQTALRRAVNTRVPCLRLADPNSRSSRSGHDGRWGD